MGLIGRVIRSKGLIEPLHVAHRFYPFLLTAKKELATTGFLYLREQSFWKECLEPTFHLVELFSK